MKKQNKKTTKDYYWHLKLQFVIATTVFFVVTFGIGIISAFYQAGLINDVNYLFYTITSTAVPLLILLISYLFAPKNLGLLNKLFWTFLLGFIAMLIYITMQTVSWYLPLISLNYATSNDSYMMSEMLRLTISFVPVLLYFSYIYWLKSKQLVSKK